jgi:hypothetical protein
LQQGKQSTPSFQSKSKRKKERERERERKKGKEREIIKRGIQGRRRVSVQLGYDADRRAPSKLATVNGAELRKSQFQQQQLIQRGRGDVKVGSLCLPGQGGRDWEEEDGGQREGSSPFGPCWRRNQAFGHNSWGMSDELLASII